MVKKLEKTKSMPAVVEGVKNFQEGNFLIRLRPARKLNFEAGQFVMVGVGREERPFSVSSSMDKEVIELLISQHPGGKVTPKLAKMKKGDKVRISGPYGSFIVRETGAKELVFIAAGTGIAPFRAMIIRALKKFPEKKASLIFGFRHDFYFEKIWKDLEKSYKNFKVCACCSKPGKNWKGFSGRVTEHMEKIIKNSEDKEVYVCGPEAMVKSVKEILFKLGFKKNQIRIEEWRSALMGGRNG